MMNDVVLQVLLILAYLAIGLFAVTFPIYAICVTFLPQERWESEKERKKRIEKLRAKISKLTAQLKGEKQDSERFIQLKEEIGNFETELKGTELRVHCLTAKGAVGLPVAYLTLALFTIGIAIYFFELEIIEGTIVFGLFSGLCSGLTVQRLYKTISAVEYAALRPARTVDFEIGFGMAEENTKQVKLNKPTELRIGVFTYEDNVENCVVYVTVPSEIEVSEKATHPDIIVSRNPDYTFVSRHTAFLPKGMGFGLLGYGTPKKIGEYVIKVGVCAKGIYEVKKELTLKVVK